jgi:ABC-type transport system substrate-binding protein
VGVLNPAVPAALKDWAFPWTSSAKAPVLQVRSARAKKLLAEAGYANGFPATLSYATYGSTIQVDAVQLLLKYLKDIGIDAKPIQQEYGRTSARPSTASTSPWPSAANAVPRPDNYLFGPYMPNELKNQSHVNDPVLGDLMIGSGAPRM